MMNMLKRNDCTKRGKKNRQMHNRSSWWKIDEITRKMNALYKNIKGEKKQCECGQYFRFYFRFYCYSYNFFRSFCAIWKFQFLTYFYFFSENFVFRILNFLILSNIFFFSFQFISFRYSLPFFPFRFVCFFFAFPPFSICLRMYVFHFVSSKDESLRVILVSCHSNT